ncbi:FxsA family protein [Effusibacillus pohliae]|uniref:FxsA family protein n=1 Tax=Effusibacillus pohliae TaxID=232270 RepID=UPI000380BCBA|nr:FxsA family protein [Effusibacillus pohliae]
MFRILFLLFIVVPIVELYILIQVGKVIGGWQTILLVLLTSGLGAYLAKTQGRTVWRRLQTELSLGRPPGDALLDGVCVLLGGLLLLTPGFATDVLGLILLLPPTRVPIKRIAKRWIAKRLSRGTWIVYRR